MEVEHESRRGSCGSDIRVVTLTSMSNFYRRVFLASSNGARVLGAFLDATSGASSVA